jgi:hypothetical protein
MTIYRGTGGGGNATTDTEVALLTQLEQSAVAAAAAAEAAQAAALLAATEAAESASSIEGDVASAEAARIAAEAAQEAAEEAQDAAVTAQGLAEAARDAALAAEAALENVYTKDEADDLLDLKANQATTYTKTETDIALALKLNAANPSYTGTLTGGTGVINIGSGQFYKDTSGNVGIGTSSPTAKLHTVGNGLFSGSGLGQYLSVATSSTNTSAAASLFLSTGNRNYAVQVLNDVYRVVDATTDVERYRLDFAGRHMFGTASDVGGTMNTVTAPDRWAFTIRDAVSNNSFILFNDSAGSQVGGITRSGSTTVYSTSSDYRLKENVQPMTGALAMMLALKPCTYTWKNDGSAGQGFIAHELQEVCPSAVVGEKDAVNENGSIKPQGIDTSFLVATLTAALQEQQAIITALTARVEALESK